MTDDAIVWSLCLALLTAGILALMLGGW